MSKQQIPTKPIVVSVAGLMMLVRDARNDSEVDPSLVEQVFVFAMTFSKHFSSEELQEVGIFLEKHIPKGALADPMM